MEIFMTRQIREIKKKNSEKIKNERKLQEIWVCIFEIQISSTIYILRCVHKVFQVDI